MSSKSVNLLHFESMSLGGGDTFNVGKTSEDWKNDGNKYFVKKNYRQALHAYTSGLNISPKDLDILSNRAAANINLKLFGNALRDCDVVLTIDPSHAKAIYRKAKALCGLEKYSDAIDYLTEKVKSQSQYAKEIKVLLQDAKVLLKQQKTGHYDILNLIKAKPNQMYGFADYLGPVQVADINVKGRGLIATEDIKAGQILIGCKAFAIVFPKLEMPIVLGKTSGLPLNTLAGKVEERLNIDAELKTELKKLYAGEISTDLKKKDDAEPDSDSEMKSGKIRAICYYNNFEINESTPISSFYPLKSPNEVFCGLWLLPSYINHSCFDSNSRWTNFGNFLIVRAFKEIPKGEEILISYFTPIKSYQDRQIICESYNFTCNCSICKLEKMEGYYIGARRSKLMEEIDENQDMGEEVLLGNLKKLELLRPDNPELNFCIVSCLEDIIFSYLERGQRAKATKYLEKAYELTKGTTLSRLAIGYSVHALKQFYAVKNARAAKIWLKKFENSVEAVYGKSEKLNYYILEQVIN